MIVTKSMENSALEPFFNIFSPQVKQIHKQRKRGQKETKIGDREVYASNTCMHLEYLHRGFGF